MEDDNLFDEDEALDYILYEEIDKTSPKKNGSGCLSLILVAMPTISSLMALTYLIVV
jgi:hypothetical protein